MHAKSAVYLDGKIVQTVKCNKYPEVGVIKHETGKFCALQRPAPGLPAV